MTRADWNKRHTWFQLCLDKIREYLFLVAWVLAAWAFHRYIVKPFPLDGPPRLMLHAFEGLFDIYTLLQLIMKLFFPYHSLASLWFMRKPERQTSSQSQRCNRSRKRRMKR